MHSYETQFNNRNTNLDETSNLKLVALKLEHGLETAMTCGNTVRNFELIDFVKRAKLARQRKEFRNKHSLGLALAACGSASLILIAVMMI